MGERNVEIDQYQKEPCLLYWAIFANAATGKSNCLSILKNIELYNKNVIKDSKVINGIVSK